MTEKLAFGVEPSARRYRLRLARYAALAEAVGGWLRENPASPRPVRLLDVGSGNGRTLRYLAANGLEDQIDFWALELDQRRLRNMYAPERWTRIIRCDVTQPLPVPDGAFDIA